MILDKKVLTNYQPLIKILRDKFFTLQLTHASIFFRNKYLIFGEYIISNNVDFQVIRRFNL